MQDNGRGEFSREYAIDAIRRDIGFWNVVSGLLLDHRLSGSNELAQELPS
jgi:hypothetical protein